MMRDEYLTANEVAERLKLNVETIYGLMKSGQLPAIKIGGRWRMEASALREWFRARARDIASTGSVRRVREPDRR